MIIKYGTLHNCLKEVNELSVNESLIKTKRDSNDKIERHKAKLVAKSYTQKMALTTK